MKQRERPCPMKQRERPCTMKQRERPCTMKQRERPVSGHIPPRQIPPDINPPTITPHAKYPLDIYPLVDDIVESLSIWLTLCQTKPSLSLTILRTPTSVDSNVVAAVNHPSHMTCGVFTTELKKVFHVQTTTLKAGIVACSLMLVPTIQAFGIFLMCFVVNNPSTKSSSPRFKPANQHHHNVARTRPSVSA